MNIRDIFALNLRTLRHARGYSQEELADRANIHRTYVSALERCQYSATIDMVASLAKVLGVDAAALLRSSRDGTD
ncbi:helix-turn-helix domain-containing protein [Sinorhizobium medicae]|uniref:Helix-turn-helix domain-containing protein n=2 Tax=Sinorhizobium medicae TaxID=110321 RepID=A0A6G1WLK8_9HYPH|nr:helix-turn-helix transcriptional regulator [Sinorhizobium medicae]ABR64168.1 transcriptional regulator, XRE family [Sinorhizobium medicae WSM419]MBO1944548.1 helix-turn-helix transcriptional regulator [Sinorhizobium medicae]MDX0409174.1 helix-turn-helix domain-containing protein [Sinorhizobium medicae]MDX0421178.1 helix-turn-helix domain-containing protein [Sinorhizobium medicae]MDX0427105.1 helix-turn-helix domain-containing protein [Sinorhizobium medicae]